MLIVLPFDVLKSKQIIKIKIADLEGKCKIHIPQADFWKS